MALQPQSGGGRGYAFRVLAVVASSLAMAPLAAGCSSRGRPAQAAPRSGSASAAFSPAATSAAASPSTTGTTTTVPPTTTTTVPRLPAPAPISPLVTPALAGEGAWQPSGDPVPGGYALYTTLLRPAAGHAEVGVAWIDPAAARMALYAGTSEPSGSWPQQGYVAAAAQPKLLAAFNSGFKIYSYRTGWFEQGTAAVPLQPGAASLVIFSNGSATVGEWGRDVNLGPSVAAVRQNLGLLVDHGAPTPAAADPSAWGAVLGGGSVTWRSGVGVTAGGDLVYVGGPQLTPELLATSLVAAGAERAMELDINPEWVSLATFTHTPAGAAVGANLIPGTYYSANHYLAPYSRDFIALFSR
ncbi:MAG TPA: hypothetical protein VFH58_14415 [Acidimicrobiales bacterium]|nr:hypothetical protein [Acidimicrobiales bacterium]